MLRAIGKFIVAALLGTVAALLPQATRQALKLEDKLPLALGTFLGSLVQGVVVLLAGIAAYGAYDDALTAQLVWMVMEEHPFEVTHATLMYTGGTHYLGFLFATPQGWALLYFFAEALVRLVSGLVVAEPLCTLPAWLIERLVMRLRSGARALKSRRNPADRVTRAGDSVCIYTCQELPWSPLSTIAIDEQLYCLVDQSELPADQRPYRLCYRLAPITAQHLIREITPYTVPAAPSPTGGQHAQK